MKMKTIIRQTPEGGLRVNTLPYDSDTGITHQIFYPSLIINDDLIAGFGFTEKPIELENRPVIVIEGEGDTSDHILEGMLLIISRMCDVLAALVYYDDLDYNEYEQEVDLYPEIMKLIVKYCNSYHSDIKFATMAEPDDIVEGNFPFKLIWKVENDEVNIFKLPTDNEKLTEVELSKAQSIEMINIDDTLKMSYGANPTTQEPGSTLLICMAFNKREIMLNHVMWALEKFIDYSVMCVPSICEPNKDVRLYASRIFSTFSTDAKILRAGVSNHEKN